MLTGFLERAEQVVEALLDRAAGAGTAENLAKFAQKPAVTALGA